ncbi:MAG: hypothetical protein EA350_12910 [Gemmatimonadales bacterium]|nr:MAG: hypothetical protein EA350_12910 [Gemmatimonadales bacterium]
MRAVKDWIENGAGGGGGVRPARGVSVGFRKDVAALTLEIVPAEKGGGALVALVPVRESVEVEGRFSLTGFTLTDPNARIVPSDQPAWIRTIGMGLRNRLR